MTSNTGKDVVDPEWIKAQRAAGWPDIHPEDYCHRCGSRNPNWWTDAPTWATATAAWAAETGREGICCPDCLILMHEAATGRSAQWQLVCVTAPAESEAT